MEEEKQNIRTILNDLAEYYSIQLSERQIEMYIEDLIEMGSENVMRSVSEYRKDWNSKQFPLPAMLRKQIYYGVAC